MYDGILKALPGSTDSDRSNSPRQVIESITELLRSAEVVAPEIEGLFEELSRSLERCTDARKASDTYEAALLRAPWLTTSVERLRQQCSSLHQSLQALRMLAKRGGTDREVTDQLVRQFNDFTELFLEHEAAESNFLASAYPGPDWAQG